MSINFIKPDADVNVRSETELIARLPNASGLPAIAGEHGLIGFFVNVNEKSLGTGNVCKNDGVYFVICRDEDARSEMNRIICSPDKMKELIDDIDPEGGTIDTKHALIPLNYITNENAFMLYQRAVRTIHDLAAVKSAYGEQGFNPPDRIARETVNAIHVFIAKRYAADTPKNLRDLQEEGMKKFIRESAKRYAENKPIRHRTIRPHEVRFDYFFKNSIKCVNDIVTDDFLQYLKQRWDECPDFVMYKENKPFIDRKDMSKTPEEIAEMYPGMEDYWKDLGKEKLYRISYPAGYENTFNAWKFDFAAKLYTWQFVVPLDQLDRQYKLETINIDYRDIYNWASLCKANGVACAINHGEIGKMSNSTSTYSFIYSDKDSRIVKAIQTRLAKETAAYSKDFVVPGRLYYLSEKQLESISEKDKERQAKLEEKEAKRNERRDKIARFFGREPKGNGNTMEVVKGMGYCSGYDYPDM